MIHTPTEDEILMALEIDRLRKLLERIALAFEKLNMLRPAATIRADINND